MVQWFPERRRSLCHQECAVALIRDDGADVPECASIPRSHRAGPPGFFGRLWPDVGRKFNDLEFYNYLLPSIPHAGC